MRRIPNYYFRLGLSGAININKSKQNQLIYKQATIHASFTRRSTFCDLAMSMIGITQILISDIKDLQYAHGTEPPIDSNS